MGKVLIFKNGHSVTFTDNSSITDLQTVVTYATVDGTRVSGSDWSTNTDWYGTV